MRRKVERIASWKQNSVSKRREAKERAEEDAEERAEDSILETEFVSKGREAVERAEERSEEGAEERGENSILETEYRFQMPSIGAS